MYTSISRGKIVVVALSAWLIAGSLYPAQAQWLRTLQTWGWNQYGQLGNGSTLDSSIPGQVNNLAGVVAVAAGYAHGLALMPDTTVWAWGDNNQGDLGNGSSVTQSNVPVHVTGLAGVIAIAAGDDHSLALTKDGGVWAWGFNVDGELGDGTTENRSAPVQVIGLTNVVAISAGGNHSMALKADGTVWSWGWNQYGQLGDGTLINRTTPVQVGNLSGVVTIAAGYAHSLALTPDGSVWAWGDNNQGDLGNGSPVTQSSIPVRVSNLIGVVAFAAGYDYSLAVEQDGTLWAWGFNNYGQLGDGSTSNSFVPVQVSDLAGVTSISAGAGHSLALRTDGTLWAWGENDHGELGIGTQVSSSLPVQVTGVKGVAAIARGGNAYNSLVIQRGAPFDLTGAGANDFLWRNTADGTLNYVLPSANKSANYGAITSTVPNDWQVVAQPDINGDGIPDIVWQNPSTGDVTYYLMSGTGCTGQWGTIAPSLPLGWEVVAAADMDGDGSPDLVFQNTENGDVTYLQVVNGQWTGKWAYLSQGIPPQWRVVGAVDLFNDGNNDLVWWNRLTGDVTYFHMDHTTWTGAWDYIAVGVPTDWRVVGLADFTGDGQPDIVWQNMKSSDVTYYEVKNQQWTGNWGYLSQGIPAVWQLTGLR